MLYLHLFHNSQFRTMNIDQLAQEYITLLLSWSPSEVLLYLEI